MSCPTVEIFDSMNISIIYIRRSVNIPPCQRPASRSCAREMPSKKARACFSVRTSRAPYGLNLIGFWVISKPLPQMQGSSTSTSTSAVDEIWISHVLYVAIYRTAALTKYYVNKLPTLDINAYSTNIHCTLL
jgi:hypothetical protein